MKIQDYFKHNIEPESNNEEKELTNSLAQQITWPKYKMIDAHLHVVDFLWRTEWLKKLIYYMNKYNIMKSVVFWTSVRKIWKENEKIMPEYYLDDDNSCYYDSSTDLTVLSEYNSLNEDEKERIYPLLCGFNPMDINAIHYIEKMFDLFPWIFCGIWEVFYRHDDLTYQTEWEPPRMNTIATKKILEFVSKKQIPFSIHNNISSPWIRDYPKFLNEMEEMLIEYPRAKVILSHCWASRRINIKNYDKLIERLLREHENLYVDYSWVIFDEVIAINNVSLDNWVKLTEKFKDRVLIGSDILWMWFHKIWIENAKFNKFLSLLSDDARNKVCYENAINLFWTAKENLKTNNELKFNLNNIWS